MELQLAGRRALVTGSSSGIGAGIARMLVEEGAAVVVHGRDRDRSEAVAAEVGAVGAVLGDLGCDAAARNVFDAAEARLGGIDILVNNAGGGSGGSTSRKWLEVDEGDWVSTYHGNTLAATRLIRRCAPGMVERGFGRIIQIGSAVAGQPTDLGPDYSAAKAAMLNMTVGLAKALEFTGVTVNCVSPGIVSSPSVEAWGRAIARDSGWGDSIAMDEIEARLARERLRLPAGRIGRPEDVAMMVCLLASPRSGYVTGANMRVDGGQSQGIN